MGRRTFRKALQKEVDRVFAMAGGPDAAEGPWGGSARLREHCPSQHSFRSQRRFAAIQKREKIVADMKLENAMLKIMLKNWQEQLRDWSDWWVSGASRYEKADDISYDAALETGRCENDGKNRQGPDGISHSAGLGAAACEKVWKDRQE